MQWLQSKRACKKKALRRLQFHTSQNNVKNYDSLYAMTFSQNLSALTTTQFT